MNDKSQMTFEQASLKLDEIVKKLEDKDCPLDESIRLYKEAYELIAYCKAKLDEARGEIIDINEKIASLQTDTDDLFED